MTESSPLQVQFQAFNDNLYAAMIERFARSPEDRQEISAIIWRSYDATLGKLNLSTFISKTEAVPPHQTVQVSPADLILLAKVYPTLDEPMKSMLLGVADLPSATQDPNPIGLLTSWMLENKSGRYKLFMEILREIASHAEKKKIVTQPLVNKGREIPIEKDQPSDVKKCCKCNSAVVPGTTRCAVHASAKKVTSWCSIMADEPPKPTEKPVKNDDVPRCQVAAGNNLLDLRPCCGKAEQLLIGPNETLVHSCEHHYKLAYQANPVRSNRPAIDLQTSVKLFDDAALSCHPLPEAMPRVCCQVIFLDGKTCGNLATFRTGYDAHLCKDHRHWNGIRDAMPRLVVPVDAKKIPFVTKNSEKAKSATFYVFSNFLTADEQFEDTK